MKNILKHISLAVLALAFAPVVHAQILVNGTDEAWSATSALSTTSSGDTTLFNVPANSNPGGVSTENLGTDYLNLAAPVAGNTYTFSFTVSTTAADASAVGAINFSAGFGNFNNVNWRENSTNGGQDSSGGPYITDVRGFGDPLASSDAVLHGGYGSAPGPNYLVNNGQLENGTTLQASSNFQLVLDTTGAQWTESLFVNGTLDYEAAFTGNPTFTGVGIGVENEGNADATQLQFSNVQLSVEAAPEPKTYAMLLAGLGLAVFVYRLRGNAFNA